MNYSALGSLPSIKTSSPQCDDAEQQDWKSLTSYQADSTAKEKVARVGNSVVFGATIYAAYASLTGPVGLGSYAVMALAARKITSTTIGYLVYPAAFTSLPCSGGDYLHDVGEEQMGTLKREGYIVKKISICKSGTTYDAALIGHSTTIDNGKWTIQALGNCMAMEHLLEELGKENIRNQSNTLLINGPSVCKSGGWPTRYQMGAGFEAGLQLLEQEIKATHIVMRGLSLGGGMMAEAILNHDFTQGKKRDISYLSISDRTFSRLSSIAGNLVGRIVEPIFYVTDTELDGIGAAKKLSDLGIRHIIVQHHSSNNQGSDQVIPDSVSLAVGLHQEDGLKNKVFLKSTAVTHSGSLPYDIEGDLNREVNQFFI